ncbi:MAG: hypothetical protein PWQ57_2786, partial [Desulfovibrionales bacterium]|nr:hypothetical protein [Desulfovibrionales bacterium]
VTDLDRWMTDPHCFLEKPQQLQSKKRKVQTIPL